MAMPANPADAGALEPELPYAAELAALPANFRQALAVRCALRAFPLLGRWGSFAFWSDADATRLHIESVARALQAGLINCTANQSRGREIIEATGVAETAATIAVAAAKPRDPKIKGVMQMAAWAANGGNLANTDSLLAILRDHKDTYDGSGNAALKDFEQLHGFAMHAMNWAPPSFFQSKLWHGPEPKRWMQDRASLLAALETVGLANIEEMLVNWTSRGIQPEAISESMQDFVAWADDYKSQHPHSDADLPKRESDPPVLEKRVTNGDDDRGTVESCFGNDVATRTDTLDRRKLARVLAQFLRDERTRAPLTLAVEGSWGSGKTTFMHLLADELDPPESKSNRLVDRRVHSVRFNPWRNQSNEELWATFALTVLEGTRDALPLWRQWCADLHVALVSLDRRRFWNSVLRLFGRALVVSTVFVFVLSFYLAGWKPEELFVRITTARFWQDYLGLSFVTASGTLAVIQVGLWLHKGLGGWLRLDLDVKLKRPDYAARASFLAEFHRDFARAVAIYSRGGPIAVFIDDLDRCDVPRAAELMQGINLMLGDDPQIFYVIGIDRAKVAAGLAAKHRDLLPFLYARELGDASEEAKEFRARGLEYGYNFLEKFIQLPFRLPPSDPERLREFIRSRLTVPAVSDGAASPSLSGLTPPVGESSGGATREVVQSMPPPNAADGTGHNPSGSTPAIIIPDESHLEEPLLHATRVLEGNPRKITQLINLVRLQRLLAPVLGVTVKAGQLTKWTAVALRWPVFVLDLTEDPKLLGQLLTEQPGNVSSRYRRWRDIPDLVNYLRSPGPTGNNSDEYYLNDPTVLTGLLRLGVAVPVADEGAAVARSMAKRLSSE